jgi:hypothetical protein
VRGELSQAHLLDQLHAAGMASQASWLTFRCRVPAGLEWPLQPPELDRQDSRAGWHHGGNHRGDGGGEGNEARTINAARMCTGLPFKMARSILEASG